MNKESALVTLNDKGAKKSSLEKVEITDNEFKRMMVEERKAKKARVPPLELKTVPKGSADDTTGGFKGPWAPFEDEQSLVAPGPSPKEVTQHTMELAATSKALKVHRVDHGKERCLQHGDDNVPYHKVPSEEECGRDLLVLEPASLVCHPPSGKLLHTWIGHEKAVNTVQFFPNSGHLLLSASMDCRIKLWDVYRHPKERPCVRTLIGHNKPVKEALFSPDGALIISLSFDRHAKVWDTETGACISRLKHRRVPYCAAMNGKDSILTGSADGTIMQWDLRNGKAELEYFEHSSPVNSIAFLDEQRFVSASDDLSLKTWDIGTCVSKRTLTLKEYDAINHIKLHPKGASLACQSLSNQIVALELEEDLGFGKRVTEAAKLYRGHNTNGYACRLELSPDGRCLSSGDGKGFVFFWDWKSAQVTKRFKGHDQACVGLAWNPQETNRVATCSWDGLIKYWG